MVVEGPSGLITALSRTKGTSEVAVEVEVEAEDILEAGLTEVEGVFMRSERPIHPLHPGVRSELGRRRGMKTEFHPRRIVRPLQDTLDFLCKHLQRIHRRLHLDPMRSTLWTNYSNSAQALMRSVKRHQTILSHLKSLERQRHSFSAFKRPGLTMWSPLNREKWSRLQYQRYLPVLGVGPPN